MGYLPVEAEALVKQEPLGLDEVRLALLLDNGRLRHNPFLANTLLEDGYTDMDLDDRDQGKVNGVLPPLDLEVNGHGLKQDKKVDQDAMDLDDADWGWNGHTSQDRNALMDTLNVTLAVGS